MPYQDGARYLNEAGSSVTVPSGDGFPANVVIDVFQLDANGEKIITGLTSADSTRTIYTLTAITVPEDGSLFIYATTATTVTVRSSAGIGHANVFFQFKMETY